MASRLQELVGVPFNKVELLDVPSRTWMGIGKGHVVPLVNSVHIFVRRRGVKCLDFDRHYDLFVKPPTMVNIRTHMRGERATIRSKLKSKPAAKSHRPDSGSDSSDVEVLHSPRPLSMLPIRIRGHTINMRKPKHRIHDSDFGNVEVLHSPRPLSTLPTQTQRHIHDSDLVAEQLTHELALKAKRAYYKDRDQQYMSDSDVDFEDATSSPAPRPVVKPEPEDDYHTYHPHKRPRYTCPMFSDEGDAIDPIYVDSASERSATPVPEADNRSPSLQPTSPVPQHVSSPPVKSDDPNLHSNASVWPAGWYTKDIVKGLRMIWRMKAESTLSSSKARFEVTFRGVPWQKSTYYDAIKRLNGMQQEDIDKSIAAGYTRAGLWSNLAGDVRLRT